MRGDIEDAAHPFISDKSADPLPPISNYSPRRQFRPSLSTAALWSFLAVSLTANFFGAVFLLYGWNPFARLSGSSESGLLPASTYSGLALDTPVLYEHNTPYWGTNQTLADELWESIDTDPMVVALSDDWAVSHGLDVSARWPWDRSKGRYFLKMFHQLHCLKYIRKNFVELERLGESQLDPHHTAHCLDLLRKDILCYGDDTPMPTNDRHTAIGDGQTLMCRNYDQVVRWAYAPERNACHRSLNEYRTIKHSIERYAFCDKDSQYHDKMQRYFDEHGHVDPYVE